MYGCNDKMFGASLEVDERNYGIIIELLMDIVPLVCKSKNESRVTYYGQLNMRRLRWISGKKCS